MASLLPRRGLRPDQVATSDQNAVAGSGPPAGRESGRSDDRIRRRFVRRQWQRRWRVWRFLLAGLALTGMVVSSVWAVYFSTLLSVSGVEVEGVDVLTPSAVRRVARVPMGDPLVRIDTAAIQTRVEALAAVRSATVTRLWPDQILIEIQERDVVATVEVGGRIRGMDAGGVLFRDYPRAPRQLPRIRTELQVDTDTLREAGKVVGALPKAVGRSVSYVSVESIDRISLVLRDGRVVLWGSAEESVDKARVLERLLAKRARYYDVSVPGLPTYRR
jgi:cell division protein FtsQ